MRHDQQNPNRRPARHSSSPTATDALQRGVIKRLVRRDPNNPERKGGFGFITAEDGTEYFFHLSVLDGLSFEVLSEQDPVLFRPDSNAPKGPRAGYVTAGDVG